MQLNKPVFVDDGTGRADEIIVRVRATRDAYITVFGVYRDSLQVLVPNE